MAAAIQPARGKRLNLRGNRRFNRKKFVMYQVIGFFGVLAMLHVGYNTDTYLPAALRGSVTEAETPAPEHATGRKLMQGFPKDIVLDGNDDLYANSSNKYMLFLHAIGTIYMFAGLAIVCDDFFVPALEVMSETWNISEDVAGATFMAAGGSAPELFTSILGIFAAENDVGFGTIVGSAVFNVLFVIGLCALFAHQALELTWWPLARDCTCYSIGLVVLVLCVNDSEVTWYEAAILLGCYGGYVTVMKFNNQLRGLVERTCTCKRGKVQADHTEEDKAQEAAIHAMEDMVKHDAEAKAAAGGSARTTNSDKPLTKKPSHYLHHHALEASNEVVRFRDFRSAVLRAMVHGHLANLNKKLVTSAGGTQLERRKSWRYRAAWANAAKAAHHENQDSERGLVHEDPVVPVTDNLIEEDDVKGRRDSDLEVVKEEDEMPAFMNEEELAEDDDSLWDVPETTSGKVLWALMLPLNFMMWITIPDCKKDKYQKFFLVSFLLSLVWIAAFSYCMVWWASVIGFALGIPSAVMGLTILAGGTSIPDALSSVIVARNGFGDMAVSSSIGSNIFDINVGLPLPWLLKTALVDAGSVVTIGSCGMGILTISLLAMVLFVILSIKFMGWKLNMALGGVMFVLYLLFVTESLLISYEVIDIGC